MSFAAGFILVGASATSVSAAEYQVEEGDTLSEIGQEHNVSVDNLKSWNDLESDLIIVNQNLEINEDDASGNEAAEATPQADQTESEENQSVEVQEDVNAEETQQETDNAAVENDENEAAAQEDEGAAEEQEEQSAPAEQESTDDQAVDQEAENNENKQDGNNDANGETMTMSATAYTADCEGCSGTTADGTDLDGDEKVIAVDPDKIPLGSEVHVEGYGDAVAGDTGGAINGDKIDLHMADEEQANEFGVQDVEVTVK